MGITSLNEVNDDRDKMGVASPLAIFELIDAMLRKQNSHCDLADKVESMFLSPNKGWFRSNFFIESIFVRFMKLADAMGLAPVFCLCIDVRYID